MLCRLLVTLVWTFLFLTIFESARAEWPKMTPDEETGHRVEQWTEEMNVNPEELGNYFEGDIMVTNDFQRNGLRGSNYRWPNGIIPYVITGHFTSDQRNRILNAMQVYHKYTCIKFKPRKGEKNYIVITSDRTGCHSKVGKIGGPQTVNLQAPNCLARFGTILHELMHAVGFKHEHTREDRDRYVYISWGNIQQRHAGNFVKARPGTTETYGTSYDYASVMHYSKHAFAIDYKKDTITPTNPRTAQIGQRKGFSPTDIKKINSMYKC